MDEMEQRSMTQDKMRQLADKVREAAYESAKSLSGCPGAGESPHISAPSRI